MVSLMKFDAMIVHLKRFVLPFCKMNKFGRIYTRFVKHGSSQASSKVLEHLKNRSLLQIRGNEASNFLQGLITNDMKHIDEGAANLYALFLNIKGRVIYDVIVYKSQEDNVFYIECDSQAADPLQKHLKVYRVRRKLDIDNVGDKIKVWALFDPVPYLNKSDIISRQKLEGEIFPCGTLDSKSSKVIDNVMIYQDPRLLDLGNRILSVSSLEKNDIKKHLNSDVIIADNALSYKALRYKLGIAEGVDDLPPGQPLPLEVNCDYLHGVNFHKGCYIGQELTARTYHTGVVRKRLMPLLFDQVPNKSISYDEKIVDESGKVIGKFRGSEKEYGLGLMRIKESLNAKSLSVLGMKLKISTPNWWPQELQTESASANRK
ncbi:iron-sulfur cluster assembly factor IBA57, mitochondrial [Megalopta genalis]|uniref:iron-sulfur cluster assembly factor IBA57, mitochondrial n=1 Tax=Megalopta genalis TaxID=115081 RepID=UPI0014431E61|nr:putative transferase CAF17 homolog, mitochondrial [Megalopta genalis]XP_033324365.1 putative transferase CAF17 homolog, mitochondrial [Megalopta genalis]